jgi:hypothetical protein
MLTNDGMCTCEIKTRFVMAKAAFNKKKNLFTSTLDLHEIYQYRMYSSKLLMMGREDARNM